MMNEPIEIIDSEEEIIELLSGDDEDFVTSTQKVKSAAELPYEVFEITSSSSIPANVPATKWKTRDLIQSSPLPSPPPPRDPAKADRILNNILNLGVSSSEDEDSDTENKEKRVPNHLQRKTSDPPDLQSKLEKKWASETTRRSKTSKLVVDENDSYDSIRQTSGEMTLRSPLRSSPVKRDLDAVVYEISDSDEEDKKLTKKRKGKLTIDSDEEIDNVIIEKHDILLSSSPAHPGNDSLWDSIENSSSIGNIVLSKTSKIKPLVPLTRLKEVDHSALKRKPSIPLIRFKDSEELSTISRKSEPSKKSEPTSVSNPFLNILMKNDQAHQSKLQEVREELRLQRENEATNRTVAVTRPSSDPAGARSSLVDLPAIATSTPAVRSRTTDSNKPRTSKDERDALKSRKEIEKRHKKLYQEANKIKRTKEELLSEMIIEIPPMLIPVFQSVEYDKELNPIQIVEKPINENCIRWERKATSRYDPDTDTFEPVSVHIVKEKISCYVYQAKEFVEKIELGELLPKFKSLKTSSKNSDNILILIIGLDAYYSRLKTNENREFQQMVKSNLERETGTTSSKTTKRKSKNDTTSNLKIDDLESAIAQLQIHGIKTFPTKNVHETVTWLRSFTYTISSARYDKYERNEDLAQIGVVRSGTDTKDTYSKMLQHFKLMTDKKASKIIDEFPTVKDLYRAIISGHSMVGRDGTKVMTGNIEIGLRKLFSTFDEGDILRDN